MAAKGSSSRFESHSSCSIFLMGIHVDPDDIFHVLLDGVVVEMTLDALSEAHDQGGVSLETLLWQEGLGEWLRLDVVLASLEVDDAQKSFAPPVAEASEMYAVLVGANEVKQMSLDQLNDAYRLSIIDNETSVWQPGFAEWVALSTLLGEEEAPPPRAYYTQNVAAPGARPLPSSFAPVAYSLGAKPDDILPDLPIRPPSSSPWFQRTLVVAGLFAVTLVFLQNGGLHQALGRRTLASVGTWVPELSLDTPRGTERFLAGVSEKYGLQHLVETAPLVKAKSAVKATNAEQSAVSEGKVEVKALGIVPPLAAPAAPLPAASAIATTTAPSTSPLPSGDLRGQVLPLAPVKPSATVPKKVSKARAKSRSGSGTYSTSNDPYDPMNGTL